MTTTIITTKRGRGRPAKGRMIYVNELPAAIVAKIRRLAREHRVSTGQVWSQVVRAGATAVGT